MRLSKLAPGIFLLLPLYPPTIGFSQTEHVIGAPFTAHEKSTFQTNGKTSMETSVLARSSDGSLYFSRFAEGIVKYSVTIEDVPNHRSIRINPRNHTYFIQPLSPGPILTVDQEKTSLQQMQQAKAYDGQTKPIGNSENTIRNTALGTREENGFTLYGRQSETVMQTGFRILIEQWEADLGVVVRSSSLQSGTVDHQETQIVTDLRREEPDATLFRIPDGYTEVSPPSR
jgi:hypothetical protein